MASYRCEIKNFNRNLKSPDGRQNTLSHASFLSGEKLFFERGNKLVNTRPKKSGSVLYIELVNWELSREKLWNAAEGAEDQGAIRRTAKEIVLNLPHELKLDDHILICQEISAHLVDTYNVAVDIAIHEADKTSDERNIHAHISLTTRSVGTFTKKVRYANGRLKKDKDGKQLTVTEYGLGDKVRELDSRDFVKTIRPLVAKNQNKHLETNDLIPTLDHRSCEERGVDRDYYRIPYAEYQESKRGGTLEECKDRARKKLRSINNIFGKIAAFENFIDIEIVNFNNQIDKAYSDETIIFSNTKSANNYLQENYNLLKDKKDQVNAIYNLVNTLYKERKQLTKAKRDKVLAINNKLKSGFASMLCLTVLTSELAEARIDQVDKRLDISKGKLKLIKLDNDVASHKIKLAKEFKKIQSKSLEIKESRAKCGAH